MLELQNKSCALSLTPHSVKMLQLQFIKVYTKIFKTQFLNIYTMKTLNIHNSLCKMFFKFKIGLIHDCTDEKI